MRVQIHTERGKHGSSCRGGTDFKQHSNFPSVITMPLYLYLEEILSMKEATAEHLVVSKYCNAILDMGTCSVHQSSTESAAMAPSQWPKGRRRTRMCADVSGPSGI